MANGSRLWVGVSVLVFLVLYVSTVSVDGTRAPRAGRNSKRQSSLEKSGYRPAGVGSFSRNRPGLSHTTDDEDNADERIKLASKKEEQNSEVEHDEIESKDDDYEDDEEDTKDDEKDIDFRNSKVNKEARRPGRFEKESRQHRSKEGRNKHMDASKSRRKKTQKGADRRRKSLTKAGNRQIPGSECSGRNHGKGKFACRGRQCGSAMALKGLQCKMHGIHHLSLLSLLILPPYPCQSLPRITEKIEHKFDITKRGKKGSEYSRADLSENKNKKDDDYEDDYEVDVNPRKSQSSADMDDEYGYDESSNEDFDDHGESTKVGSRKTPWKLYENDKTSGKRPNNGRIENNDESKFDETKKPKSTSSGLKIKPGYSTSEAENSEETDYDEEQEYDDYDSDKEYDVTKPGKTSKGKNGVNEESDENDDNYDDYEELEEEDEYQDKSDSNRIADKESDRIADTESDSIADKESDSIADKKSDDYDQEDEENEDRPGYKGLVDSSDMNGKKATWSLLKTADKDSTKPKMYKRRLFQIVSSLNGKLLEQIDGTLHLTQARKKGSKKQSQLWYEDSDYFIRSALDDRVFSNYGPGKEMKMITEPNTRRSQWIFDEEKIHNRMYVRRNPLEVLAVNAETEKETISTEKVSNYNEDWGIRDGRIWRKIYDNSTKWFENKPILGKKKKSAKRNYI